MTHERLLGSRHPIAGYWPRELLDRPGRASEPLGSSSSRPPTSPKPFAWTPPRPASSGPFPLPRWRGRETQSGERRGEDTCQQRSPRYCQGRPPLGRRTRRGTAQWPCFPSAISIASLGLGKDFRHPGVIWFGDGRSGSTARHRRPAEATSYLRENSVPTIIAFRDA